MYDFRSQVSLDMYQKKHKCLCRDYCLHYHHVDILLRVSDICQTSITFPLPLQVINTFTPTQMIKPTLSSRFLVVVFKVSSTVLKEFRKENVNVLDSYSQPEPRCVPPHKKLLQNHPYLPLFSLCDSSFYNIPHKSPQAKLRKVFSMVDRGRLFVH